jgi:hypothetical protein
MATMLPDGLLEVVPTNWIRPPTSRISVAVHAASRNQRVSVALGSNATTSAPARAHVANARTHGPSNP